MERKTNFLGTYILKRGVFWLLVISAACVAAMVVLAFSPGAITIDKRIDDANDAEIHFKVEQRWVVRAGECVSVTWQVENVKALTINDVPQKSAGERRICVEDQPKKFRVDVVLADDTLRQYEIKVGLMMTAPEIWLLTLVALVSGIAALWLTVTPRVTRRFPRFAALVRRTARGAAILSVCLMISAVLLELGLRTYFERYGSDQQRLYYTSSEDDLRRESRLRAMPFINYTPSRLGGNELAYRGINITVPKPAGVFRIVVLGDSTVYGLGVRYDRTFPAQLETVLRETYGHENVEVINAGLSGYNTWNSIVNFEFRVLELEPDLIIVYHSITDIGIRMLDPECYRGNNAHRGIAPIAGILQLRDQIPSSSTLYRFIGINLDWFEPPDPNENFEVVIACANWPKPPLEEALAANPPVYFERNLRTLAGIAQAQGVAILFSTFAYEADTPPDRQPDWWIAAPEHNMIIEQVAQDMDALFYDLRNSPLSDNPAYWTSDHLHPTEEGYAEQARLFAAYLEEAGVLR